MLVILTLATALYAMTITIANVALPKMQGAFAATPDQIAWVVTFNIIATAVGTPMTGWLAGRFGQRRVLLGAVAGFVICSALCGLSGSLVQLVVFRIGQGLFGAPLAPLSQAIVLHSAPKAEQGRATAIFGMGVVLGPVVAPSLGGYLSETYSWRWVFFIMVPVGALCWLGIAAIIKDWRRSKPVRLDWTGFLSLAISIAALQLMLDRGERNDWFESLETWISALTAATAFYIFVAHTLTARQPFFSRSLLLDRNYALGLFIALAFGMLNVTPMVLLPTMLQRLQGYPDSVIGIVLGARACGTLLGFFIMMRANRHDPRLWLLIGFGVQTAAGFNMTQFTTDVSLQEVMLSMAVQGFGVGVLWVPLTLVTFSTLKQDLFAEGMSIFHLLRNTASSAHISLSVAVLVHSTQVNYSGLVSGINPFNELLRYPHIAGQWTTDSASSMASLSAGIQQQAMMIGYINAFMFYALTALAAIPLILVVGKTRKR